MDVKKVYIYIGETDNIYIRHNSVKSHEHYDDFVKYADRVVNISYEGSNCCIFQRRTGKQSRH